MNAQATNRPVLVVQADPRQAGGTAVVLYNLDADQIASLASHPQGDDLLRSMLRVTVGQPESPGDEDLPAIIGRHEVLQDGIRFVPHFPFERGVRYHASFDPRRLNCIGLSEMLTLDFSLPAEQNLARAEVTRVFPSADVLPENLLRLYVCFSSPMQRGRAEEQIALLGPEGRPVPNVLYRPPVELWDKGMKCLTVLLDPGRLKRRVGPNLLLGPPLEVGRQYTLRVGSGMLDLSGRPISEPFYKPFRVTAAVRENISLEQWEIVAPSAGTRLPLVIISPRPLDWALFSQSITIASADGRRIEGRVVLGPSETQWSFTPNLPWAAGGYRIRVGADLEDVCGNSIASPFDRVLRPPSDSIEDSAERSITFQLKGLARTG